MSDTSKYQVRLDAPRPSPAEVEAHKDFQQVLRQYKRSAKRPQRLHAIAGRLNRLLPLAIIALALLLFLLFYLQWVRQWQREQAPPAKPDAGALWRQGHGPAG
jgi:hypothetical protein